MAERINFTWNSGPNSEFYQLFENGTLTVDNIVEPTFSLLMTDMVEGSYSYQVRGVNQFGEGPLSDPVVVNFIRPVKVTGLEYTIV